MEMIVDEATLMIKKLYGDDVLEYITLKWISTDETNST